MLALASAQLLVPAALALFLYSPARRAALLPFLRLAKILQVFPVLLLTLALALPGFAPASARTAEGSPGLWASRGFRSPWPRCGWSWPPCFWPA